MADRLSYCRALVVPAVLLQVDGLPVQPPDEGDVQRGVVRRAALHLRVLTHVDVSVGGGQGDLGRIWEGSKVTVEGFFRSNNNTKKSVAKNNSEK